MHAKSGSSTRTRCKVRRSARDHDLANIVVNCLHNSNEYNIQSGPPPAGANLQQKLPGVLAPSCRIQALRRQIKAPCCRIHALPPHPRRYRRIHGHLPLFY
uniref:Uncharacterized protein n=1 Tax=Oryza nivara TaxID=4536 RepID=A0A679BAB1_ORYNI|nr:hypothetical protein [Oryza sativa f. spontanea]